MAEEEVPAATLAPEPPEQPRSLEPAAARVLPTWEQVAPDFRTAFPTLDENALRQRYEHNRRLSQERARYANAQETTLGYVGRRAIPFGSAAAQANRTAAYGEAMRRFEGGQPGPDDYGLIAAYERQQHLDQEEGIGGSLMRIPAMVGEAYYGGRMLGAAGAFGRGAATPAVGAAQAIGRAAQYTGRAALTTAHMPSMWLPEWAEDNVSRGRRPYDMAGLPRALGLGTLQTMVFGSLGRIANDIPGAEVGDYVRRLAMRTGVGVVEQQGIDLISGVLTANSDRPTGFGVLGDLVAGRGGQALQRLSHQAVLFGAFAALHEVQHAPITREFADALQAYARAGRSRGEAAAELAPVTAMHEEQLQAGRNKEEMRTLYEAMPEGPARDYALALAHGAPAAPIPQGPLHEPYGPDVPPRPRYDYERGWHGGREGTRPPEAPLRLTREPGREAEPAAPRVSSPMTPEQASAALTQEQARMQAEGRNAARRPEQEAAPPEPPPEPPPERFGTIPEADVRGVAQQLGLKATGKRAEVIERIVRQGGEHFLTALEGGEAKPAGPKVIPPEPAVPIAPHVERAFLEAFPGGNATRRGELQAEVGGRTVYVSHDAGRNMARIDFEAERPGVPAEMQAGSLSLARSLRTLAGKLAATGVGVEYRAIDTNRGGPERRQARTETGFRRRRSDVYADALTKAGYEQIGGPGVDKGELYEWRPSRAALEANLPREGIHPDVEDGSRFNLRREGHEVGSIKFGTVLKESHEAGAARDLFPGVTQEGQTFARMKGVTLNASEQGKGQGQQLLLEGMRQHGADWYFNSQASPQATNALSALARKGLIELHWHKPPEALREAGPFIARVRRAGETPTPPVAPEPPRAASEAPVAPEATQAAPAQPTTVQESQQRALAGHIESLRQGIRERRQQIAEDRQELEAWRARSEGSPGRDHMILLLRRRIRERIEDGRNLQDRLRREISGMRSEALPAASSPPVAPLPPSLLERLRQRANPEVQAQPQPEPTRPPPVETAHEPFPVPAETLAPILQRWRSGQHVEPGEILEAAGLTEKQRGRLEAFWQGESFEDIARREGVRKQAVDATKDLLLKRFGMTLEEFNGLKETMWQQEQRRRVGAATKEFIEKATDLPEGDAEALQALTQTAVREGRPIDTDAVKRFLSGKEKGLSRRQQANNRLVNEMLKLSQQQGGKLTREQKEAYRERFTRIRGGDESALGQEEAALGISRRGAAERGAGEPTPLRREGGEVPAGSPPAEVSPPRARGPEVQASEAGPRAGETPGGPAADRPPDAPAPAGGGAAGGHELTPAVHPLLVDILRGGDLHVWRQLETVLRREYGVSLPDVRAMQKAAKEAAGPGLPEMTVKMKTGRGHHAQVAARLTQEQLIEHINRAMDPQGVELANQALRRHGEKPLAAEDHAEVAAEIGREAQGAEGPEAGQTHDAAAGGPGPATEVEPGAYFAPTAAQRAGAAGGPAGAAGSRGAFDLTRTIESWMPTYREGGRPQYRTREQAALIGKMAAGDVPSAIHELAHHIATQERMPLEPSKLPQDVAAGLRQFDYEPNRTNQREAMQEGFAEWLRRRTMGQLQNLSPEQQSAARYLETLMTLAAPEGEPRTRWAQRLDQLRTLYGQMAGGTPTQQAGGLLSATGKPPAPVLTPAEQAGTLWKRISNWWQDNVTNNLGVLQRAGMERAHTLWGRLQFGEQGLARRFGEEGVGTLRDGRWTVIGPSKAKIVETLIPADLEPLRPQDSGWWAGLQRHWDGPQQVSRAGVWAAATHILSEHEAGRTVVPEEQLALYRQARAEMARDEAFVRRATEAHRRLTEAYNATRRALASPDVHRLSPETVERWEALRPDYVPTTRVKEDADWKATASPRSRGRENMAEIYFPRGGSGEQIVDPFVGYEQRLASTATQLAEQLRRNAVAEYLQQPGMGEWALQNKEPVIGMDGQTAYWKPEPWSKDPAKNTWYWYGPDGELQNWRVKDRALYDLLTHQQGNDSSVTQFFRAMSNIAPLRWSAEAVRKGATYLSLGFQARNVSPWRDPYEFLKNTIDQASVARLPEFYRRVYAAEAAILRGNIPADEVFNLFARERGREQRQFAFETPGVETARSKAEIVKQVLNVAGAGELAPRMLEFVNRLKAQGWTEARLEAEIKRARDVQRQGGEYQDPVPWSVLQDAMQAANEVTVPFSRLGTVTREVNKLVPFFGPAVSGISKAVRNWKENTKGAAVALGAYLTARLAYWAAYKDEDWYKELSAHDRFNNFVVPIPGLGLRRLPGARDFEVPVGGALTSSLEALSGQRPDVAGLIAQSYQAVMPPAPVPPVANVAWQLGTNRNWMGQPIVPRRDENLPAGHNLLQHQAPYAAEQLLGGGGGLIRRGAAGLMPFSEVRNAHRSVDEVYDRLHGLEAQRTLVRRQGLAFPQEREYQVLHHAAQQITRLGQTAAGRVHVGTRVVEREAPPEERVRELRTRQVELARRALGAAR